MKKIQETCNLRVLVLASLNREVNIVTDEYSWGEFYGKKFPVFSLRESFRNGLRSGWPQDPLKFYMIWQKGEEEETFFAKQVKFSGWAGSSFNIADHLVSLGMTDVTLSAFVDQGPELKDLHDYLISRNMKFIPLWASNTGKTFVFEDDHRSDSVVCMEKPATIDCTHNRNKLLEQKWDVIIASSVPANPEVLNMMIDIFKANTQSIKTLMPSLALIQNENLEVKNLLTELISMTTVFQVNDIEAGRYINLTKYESPQKPLYRRELVMNLAKELHVPVLVVTMGQWGSAVVVSDGSQEFKSIHQDATKPKWTIRSTVGSGDAFHAGFMRVYSQTNEKHQNDSLNLAAKIGSEIAIRNICVWGANMSQDESKKLSLEEFMGIVQKR